MQWFVSNHVRDTWARKFVTRRTDLPSCNEFPTFKVKKKEPIRRLCALQPGPSKEIVQSLTRNVTVRVLTESSDCVLLPERKNRSSSEGTSKILVGTFKRQKIMLAF